MHKTLAVLCGAVAVVGCSSVPIQKVESNSACDYALMARIEAQRMPDLTHRYWVNCPQVEPQRKS
jgi:hypothetical protein